MATVPPPAPAQRPSCRGKERTTEKAREQEGSRYKPLDILGDRDKLDSPKKLKKNNSHISHKKEHKEIRNKPKVDNIANELILSATKEQVENVFAKKNITDKSARIKHLRECMRVLDTSEVGEALSEDEEYNSELEIFLIGEWRMLL